MKTIICPKCGAEQLASYDTCSYPHCDKSLIETKRIDSINWWYSLTFEEKFFKVIEWLNKQGRDTTERHPYDLSNSEITTIFGILSIYALKI